MYDSGGQWEYYVEYIPADSRQNTTFVQQFYPQGNVPIYAVQSALPRLNQLGELGWELVQIQPVVVGNNGDILVCGSDSRHWTNIYLCAFKRYKNPAS